MQTDQRNLRKSQLPQRQKMAVVGNQKIGPGGDGYVHKLIVVGVVGDELPFVVGLLKSCVGRIE